MKQAMQYKDRTREGLTPVNPGGISLIRLNFRLLNPQPAFVKSESCLYLVRRYDRARILQAHVNNHRTED